MSYNNQKELRAQDVLFYLTHQSICLINYEYGIKIPTLREIFLMDWFQDRIGFYYPNDEDLDRSIYQYLFIEYVKTLDLQKSWLKNKTVIFHTNDLNDARETMLNTQKLVFLRREIPDRFYYMETVVQDWHSDFIVSTFSSSFN